MLRTACDSEKKHIDDIEDQIGRFAAAAGQRSLAINYTRSEAYPYKIVSSAMKLRIVASPMVSSTLALARDSQRRTRATCNDWSERSEMDQRVSCARIGRLPASREGRVRRRPSLPVIGTRQSA